MRKSTNLQYSSAAVSKMTLVDDHPVELPPNM
jgi:hypothetical protein